MPKIIQFKSLGGPEVLEFKDIALSKELGLDEILYSVKAFEFTRKIAENESQKALKSLKNIPESDYKSALKLLCELSLSRTS